MTDFSNARPITNELGHCKGQAMKILDGTFVPVLVGVLCFATWGASGLERSASETTPDTALVGAKIYPAPDAKPIVNGVVIVENGKITAVGDRATAKIPSGATVLDCSGMVLTAGFQNNHIHMAAEEWDDIARIPAPKLTRQLQDMLTRHGFTTVVDLGSVLPNTLALRNRIESGEVPGPRILSAGQPIFPKNGIPAYLKDKPPDVLKLFLQPSTPEEATADVRSNIASGANVVKIMTSTWVGGNKVVPMRVDIATAAVGEAHRHKLLVFTHESDVPGLEVALQAHVDVLAHAVRNTGGWNDSYLSRMKAANTALIPTLDLYAQLDWIADILHQVGEYSRAGGQILFGTDAGDQNGDDPTQEYVLMQRAGLSFSQILASLTTAPAERFGESGSHGRIAPGMDADLVVLAADPADDIRAFAKVRYTIRRGAVIFSAGSSSTDVSAAKH
jgi:imidazolonepropionase-like amidohydrolase